MEQILKAQSITLEQARILLGEIAYHDTIERVKNGFNFVTTSEFTREMKIGFISDDDIQNCIRRFGSVKNEGTQVEARMYIEFKVGLY